MAAFDRSRLFALARTWVCGPGALHLHAAVFAVAAVALTLLNLAVDAERLWFWRPLLVWAVALAAHGLVVAYRCGVRVPSVAATKSPSEPVAPVGSPPPAPPALSRRLALTVNAVREATRPSATPPIGSRGGETLVATDWNWSPGPLPLDGPAPSDPRPTTPAPPTAVTTPAALGAAPGATDTVLPAARFAKVAALLRQAALATSAATIQADGNGHQGSFVAGVAPVDGAGNGASDGAPAGANGTAPAWAAAWPTGPVSPGANGANGHNGAPRAGNLDHVPEADALPETIVALWQPRSAASSANGVASAGGASTVRPIAEPPASALPEVPEVGGRGDRWGEPALAAFAPSHPDSSGGTASGAEFTWA